MGRGRAISSIFLVKEFGVQVLATDLWIKPSENAGRIRDADVEDRVSVQAGQQVERGMRLMELAPED